MSSLKIHDPRLNKAKIQSAVAKYGYNLRTLRRVLLMNEEETIQKKILDRITETDAAKLNTILATNADTANSSHLVIMTWCPRQPAPATSDNPKNCVSGSFASQALVNSHGFRYLQSLRDLGDLFSANPYTATAGGWCWEHQCHLTFINLGHMELVRTTIKDGTLFPAMEKGRERIAVESLTLKIYSPKKDTVETTSKIGVYYVPNIRNNPTFDAFFRVGRKAIALQITIATTHSVNPLGLDEFYKRTPGTKPQDRYFVFVIPKGQGFECKEPPDGWPKGSRYFILEMDRGMCCQFSLNLWGRPPCRRGND